MSDQVPNKFYLNGTFHHVQIGLENNTGITNQNESWQDEQQSIRDELQGTRDEVKDLKERVGDFESELDAQQSIREKLRNLKGRVGDLETELDRVKEKNTELENDAANSRDEQGNLKDRVEDLETELDLVKKKNAELENDAANSRDEIDNLRKMMKKLSSDMVNLATDSRSKTDHLTNVVKTLKETSNETKEMTGGKREGPILKKKRGLENVAPCSIDQKETLEFIRDNRKILTSCLDNATERYRELVNDAVSSGDEIDSKRLWDMAVEETIEHVESGYSGLDPIKAREALRYWKICTQYL